MDALESLKRKQLLAPGEVVLMNVAATLVGVLLGWVGYQVTDPSMRLTPFWPMSGLFLILYYCFGSKAFPALFLNVFLVTYGLTNRPAWACALMALGNMTEPVLGVLIIQAMRRAGTQFGTFTNALTIVAAGFLSPIPCALIGGVLVSILKGMSITGTLSSVATWWTGHVIGIVVFAPLIAAWMARPKIAIKEWVRFAGLALILVGMAVFVFRNPIGACYLFLLFPLLLLASCWLPHALLYTLALALQITAIVAFVGGGSVYHTGSPFENVFNLQFFFVTVGITALSLTGFRCTSPLQAPALALIVGWVFSGIVFGLVTIDGMEADRRQVRELVRKTEQSVQGVFDAYVDTMRAVAGFISGSDDVRRNEWLRFIDYLDWEERSPGLQGIGVLEVVRDAEIPSFVQKMRRRGYADFQLKDFDGTSLSPAAEHVVLTLIAPEAGNTGVIGLDLNSEPQFRAAIERSRASREPTLSEQVTPIASMPGELSYSLLVPFRHPLLVRGQGHLENVTGFIYSPFHVERFFEGVLGRTEQLHADVFLAGQAEDKPIFRSQGEAHRRGDGYAFESRFDLGGQEFRIGWDRSPTFRTSLSFVTVLLSCTGALLSLVLAGLVRKLELAGSDARQLAQQRAAELKERDFQVAEQAATLSRIMNSVPVGIFRSDRKGLLVLCNQEWGVITGRIPERMRGISWLTPFHRDDREDAAKLLAEAMDRRTQVQGEFRVVRPDGNVRTVQVILVAEADRAQLGVGFLGTIQDLTNYKAAQDVLEMQRAVVAHSAKMASLGEMAGGIAHEINNPLAIIHGKSRQMRRMLESGQVEEPIVTESLDLIERTTMRISKIIKGLRAFSRSGEHDPFIKESLPVIVDQTLDLCRERFKNSGVDLRIGSIPAIQLECRGTQIGQVLMNLLSNAFDAVQQRAERWVRLDARDLGDLVEIAVTDSGWGIEPGLREKIFEPFFTTKDIGYGTGLGLSIARGIVADHGGRLYVDENARHTRFKMELKKDSRSQGAPPGCQI